MLSDTVIILLWASRRMHTCNLTWKIHTLQDASVLTQTGAKRGDCSSAFCDDFSALGYARVPLHLDHTPICSPPSKQLAESSKRGRMLGCINHNKSIVQEPSHGGQSFRRELIIFPRIMVHQPPISPSNPC